MENNDAKQKCCRCGDSLGEGVRFCVACGTQNCDPYAASMAVGNAELKSHKTRTFHESFRYWWRYWVSGIRR